MSVLYLCEKPSQGRDIARVLGASSRGDGCIRGRDVVVTWCLGHLLEMASPDEYDPALKTWRLDTLPIIPDRWRMKVTKRGRKQFAIVSSLLSNASELVIATDADREGETIAREVLSRCGWRGPTRRLWLSALDDASIRKALSDVWPGERTAALFDAGQARARADWLVGMNLTRAVTLAARRRGMDGVFSVGRVQTPTLALVVERDLAIERFTPIPFFEVEAVCASGSEDAFRVLWKPRGAQVEAGRCLSRDLADSVARRVRGARGIVSSTRTERKREAAPLPFSLSTLQLEASRRWGMGAQQVLNLAQALYETHKATSYPRTDCEYLPVSQHGEAASVLSALASDGRLAEIVARADPNRRSRCFDDGKISAHHAIVPTTQPADLSAMSEDEFKIFDAIRRRYLAQFFPPHEYDSTTIQVSAPRSASGEALEDGELFQTRGRVSVVLGWREALGLPEASAKGDPSLPAVTEGDVVSIASANVVEKATKPPDHYTEGALIQAMKSIGRAVEDPSLRRVLKETAGIGTEATRAGIIETLLKRGVIAKQGKRDLVSTPAGRELVSSVPEMVKDPATTALWEQRLDAIAQGEESMDVFLDEQETAVRRLVADLVRASDGGAVEKTGIGGPPRFSCPDCGSALRLIQGTFWGCSAYPECSYTAPDEDGKPGVRRPRAKIDERYPCRCGEGFMQRRKSRKGPFWGCSRYPECKESLPDADGKPGVRRSRSRDASSRGAAGEPCPTCHEGALVERTVRSGKNAGKIFHGCTNYPKCRHFSWI